MQSGLLFVLVAYSVVIMAASLLGGWLPRIMRMTHVRIQVSMSFVAGLMLGVALFHLLPHALLMLQHDDGIAAAVDHAVLLAGLGMILMLLLLRLFYFHQHDFSAENSTDHDHRRSYRADAHPLSWMGVALGLGLHSLIDGVALGASIRSGFMHEHGAALASFGVFLAILLHKPLDALSVTGLMQLGGWSVRARTLTNICFSLLCPLGMVLFLWQVESAQELVIGSALAFSAGVFLCISLGDLLPEIHFHGHDRIKLILAFLAGIGLAYSLRYLEPASMHAH